MSDLKGWKSEGAKLYNIKSIPANILINNDRVIVARDLRGQTLINKIGEQISGEERGQFTFTAREPGDIQHTYTAKFETTYSGLGAFLIIGFDKITDETGKTYTWSAVGTSPGTIEQEMGFLREFAELKIQEAEEAAISDALTLLEFDAIKSWVGTYVTDQALNFLDNGYTETGEYVRGLAEDVKNLVNLKESMGKFTNRYNPEGKNAEDIIKDIAGYHKNIEKLIAAMDAVIK